MAKCIYISARQPLQGSIKNSLRTICDKLAPDNIIANEPKIVISEYVAYGVMNPTTPLLEKESSLLMGQIFDKPENWNLPGTEFPDGSYALFRDGKEHCEIVSDPLASRTIWYYKDENLFVSSTSQRAIVMYLESFDFDERVIPWMLSTGTLGPTFSWDKRINRVPADSSVILDKNNWTISLRSNPIQFDITNKPSEAHKKDLVDTLNNFFRSLDLDYKSWVLPLSGGFDSRAILCFLAKNTNVQRLRTVTWGLESSLSIKGNDAYVARELGEKMNVPHTYYLTDLSTEPIERIVNRYVLLGEGRIDHVAAYMDGFNIWKTLFENGIKGTIRGDECFGWIRVSSALRVKLSTGCALCSDYSNLKEYRRYGIPTQQMPEFLKRRKGETFAMWRDRLYQEYRVPSVLSALSDLKFSYVEQISPFLSRKILRQVRQLPDSLRTEKRIFKNIVRAMSPKIDFATSAAVALVDDIFKRKQFVKFLRSELSSDNAKKIWREEFLDFILKGMKTEAKDKTSNSLSASLRSYAKRYLPLSFINVMRKISPPAVDKNVLAFRVFLICKMNETLRKDALTKKDLA